MHDAGALRQHPDVCARPEVPAYFGPKANCGMRLLLSEWAPRPPGALLSFILHAELTALSCWSEKTFHCSERHETSPWDAPQGQASWPPSAFSLWRCFPFLSPVYSGMQKQNGLIRLCLESINRLKAKPNQKLIQVLFSVERTLLPPAGASPTPPRRTRSTRSTPYTAAAPDAQSLLRHLWPLVTFP